MVMRSVIEEKNQSNSRNHNFLSETISIDDGKIIGTSLAGLLQFIWARMSLLLQLRHFRVNVGPTARVSPEMMQTAQQEMTELPKCILRNYGIYPLQVS
jgi:ABC-2 type transport system permease protein